MQTSSQIACDWFCWREQSLVGESNNENLCQDYSFTSANFSKTRKHIMKIQWFHYESIQFFWMSFALEQCDWTIWKSRPFKFHVWKFLLWTSFLGGKCKYLNLLNETNFLCMWQQLGVNRNDHGGIRLAPRFCSLLRIIWTFGIQVGHG